MSRCLIGREVVIAVRRKGRGPAKHYTVVCPARWTKGELLAYARAEHPDDTVRIQDWRDTGGWEPRLWIANPAGFHDYARAIKKEAVGVKLADWENRPKAVAPLNTVKKAVNE